MNQMILKRSHFPCSLLVQNVKPLEIDMICYFHQIHPINIYLHKAKHVKILIFFSQINCMILYFIVLFLFY
jgi:hypothetical protein